MRIEKKYMSSEKNPFICMQKCEWVWVIDKQTNCVEWEPIDLSPYNLFSFGSPKNCIIFFSHFVQTDWIDRLMEKFWTIRILGCWINRIEMEKSRWFPFQSKIFQKMLKIVKLMKAIKIWNSQMNQQLYSQKVQIKLVVSSNAVTFFSWIVNGTLTQSTLS